MLSSFFLKKSSRNICRFKKKPYLCIAIEKQSNSERVGEFREAIAQMAESVDALVSNTSGFTSIPVRPRVWVLRKADNRLIISLICFLGAY